MLKAVRHDLNFGDTELAASELLRREAETLRSLGCDLLQGWLFGRAEPAPVFAARLSGLPQT